MLSTMYIKLSRLNHSYIRQVSGIHTTICKSSHSSQTREKAPIIIINGKDYVRDEYSNATPHILNFLGRNLHKTHPHPLQVLTTRLVNFMYSKYVNKRGNPVFSVFDNLSPIVSTEENFDSLLIPKDHVSRNKSDTYYLNQSHVLRSHTSAHQKQLIASGLDKFLVIGDVYRRDQIDSTHYPVFHQAEGVRLFSAQELFCSVPDEEKLSLFANGTRNVEKQATLSLEANRILEKDLKMCLSSLVEAMFGPGIEQKWTDSYFPFTHPSWELEILWEGQWLEVLGCGIMEQEILNNAGAGEKVGWAFGLGLERLAMLLFKIPDIRLFWSKDTGFLSQFDVQDPNTPITYKAISKYPQCINDISFWIPSGFHENDFYDIVRSIGGEIVEQVYKIDEFFHPKEKKMSFCFRIVYRHMEKTFTQDEVNLVHNEIADVATKELNVVIR